MRSLFWVLQSTSFENGGGLDEAVGYIFWTINDYSILLQSLFRGEPRQVCLFYCFFFFKLFSNHAIIFSSQKKKSCNYIYKNVNKNLFIYRNNLGEDRYDEPNHGVQLHVHDHQVRFLIFNNGIQY